MYLIARTANWVSFPGPRLPSFPLGKGKGGSQQLLIEIQFSLAWKSWLSVCYPGHSPLVPPARPGPWPALPDGCPLDSTSNWSEAIAACIQAGLQDF